MTIHLDSLASPQRRALDLVKEAAVEKNLRPQLVGGPVRDLMLGRVVIDLDFTLEGDSSELARGLAKRINGRLRSFPQFLTYKVTAEDFPPIDIATARSEKYRQAGALPSVTAGNLADDLLRRDFSINAIAFDIMTEQLHDPTGGQRDLENQTIRVLHDLSFLDDPTRIFRALRLSTRLGFVLEATTDELMRNAIASGALTNVSRERLWRELFIAFEEERAASVVEPETVAAASVFVETRTAATQPFPAGSRELAGRDAESVTEVGEVLLGIRPGRQSPDELTLYKSMGHATEDVVAAAVVYQAALAAGVGATLSL